MKYLLYVLLGLSVLMALEMLVFIILDIIREMIHFRSNGIHIKMVKTGNKMFHLRTIQEVRGISSFPELRGQTIAFRDASQEIVAKILYYNLDNYYVMQRRFQENINIFCNNLRRFGEFLHVTDYDYELGKGVDRESIYLAVKEALYQNRSIVEYFQRVSCDLDEQIRHII